MHSTYAEIPDRIVQSALGSLSQANMNAAFFDPGNEHAGNISIMNAAHAGELFIKAIIAKEHPLLIFKNIFELDDNEESEISIERLVSKAKTHDFHQLPKILWAVNKCRVPDMESYEDTRKMRNAVQHFFDPNGLEGIGQKARRVSLEFIYKNIDPLIKEHFGLYAINYHQDHSVGYDYLVSCIVGNELKFSIPDDFSLSEISLDEELNGVEPEYRRWLESELSRIDREDLLQ